MLTWCSEEITNPPST